MKVSDIKRQTPAEWAPQYGVLLAWPHGDSDWASVLDEVEAVYMELAFHLSRHENVIITCLDQVHLDHVTQRLKQAAVTLARVSLHIVPTNDTWTRDYGPLTIVEGDNYVLLDFVFNGWGNKFTADLDNQASRRLYELGAFRSVALRHNDMVLEGGSVEFDGQGTLMTTSRCLLAPSRNPQLDRYQIEIRLKELFGIARVLWLEHGMLIGDDTDSHIDVLARFCGNDTIAYSSCSDTLQGHFEELKRMETELISFTTISGKPYRLVALPLPRPKFDLEDSQLPASYANFLITNKAVLVPTYEDPMDAVALERLGACFPDREVIGIHCLPLIFQHGSLHCITMQLPAGIYQNKE